MVEQTVSKASNGKETINLKEFTAVLLQAVTRATEKWSLGIMTPIEL
jgi:NADPH-dependent 7-cyano-7-deazaguanine reductase QueF-like protein